MKKKAEEARAAHATEAQILILRVQKTVHEEKEVPTAAKNPATILAQKAALRHAAVLKVTDLMYTPKANAHHHAKVAALPSTKNRLLLIQRAEKK